MLVELFLLLVVFTSGMVMFYIFPRIYGAPYQPTNNKKLQSILELSSFKNGEKMIDLGSGDGRIVIEFAKRGVESYGVEINPILVWWSRRKIKKLGLSNAKILRKNFWEIDFSGYDIITLFQMGTIMDKLEEKLSKETSSNVRIISHYWKFPFWKIQKNILNVFLYKNENSNLKELQ